MDTDETTLSPKGPSAIWWPVMGFVVFVMLWLGLSHYAIRLWVADPGLNLKLTVMLDGVFVLVGATLLHALLRRLLARQQQARAGERARQLLQALSDASPDAIFAKDREGRYLLANQGTSRLFGREPDEIVGFDDHQVFPEAVVQRVQADDRRAMASDTAVTIEEQIPTQRGLRTFLTIKGPIRADGGKVVGLFGIARDITERVMAQAQLEASELRYRELFEASPLPMVVYDLESLRFVSANPMAANLYGYSREQLLSMTVFDIYTPDGQARLRAEIEANGGVPLGSPGRKGRRRVQLCQDGRLVHVDVAVSEVAFDGRPARLALLKDVTDQVALEAGRAQAQAEAEKNRDLYRSVLSRVSDGFIALDTHWRYTYVNAQAAKMMGREKPDDLLGRHMWTEYPEGVGQAFHQAYLRAAETQQPVIFEAHYAPWDKWFENRVYPSPEGLTIYFTDITDRRRAEQVQADRAREFRELAEQMPALIYRAALDGSNKGLYVSQHIRVLGFTPEQWLANSEAWIKAVHPDDLQRVVAALPTATSAHSEMQIEYRMRDGLGHWRYFRDSCRRVLPDDGSTPYLQGVSVDISDLIEAERNLMESEARLRTSEKRYRLAASSGMVWDWDLEHGELNVGSEFFESLGLGPVTGVDVLPRMQALLHPDDVPVWQQAVRDCLLHQKPYDLEFRAHDARGRWRWFHTQGSALRNAAGRVTYMAGTTVDITERKQAQEALVQSEARLRQSEQRYRLAASHGRVWDWDATGCMDVGTEFWQALGHASPAPEATRDRLAELMHPQDRPTWERLVREHLLQHKPYDLEFRIADAQGRWRWMHTQGQAVWNEDGRATYMAGTTIDITDRKEAQAALETSEAYRRQLFEQLSDGVLLIGPDQRILDANPQAWNMLGRDREGLLRAPLAELLAEQEVGRLARLSQGDAQLLEWAFARADGSTFPAEVSTRALDQGRYLVVLRDISQRRQAENTLMTYQLELSELAHRLLVQEKQTTRRIAQALHDRLGQTLAVSRLHLDAAMLAASEAMSPEFRKQCQRIDTLLEQAVHEVRDVLTELRPPLLEEQGLAAALDNEVAAPAAGLSGVDLLLEVDDAVKGQHWPPDVEYGAFMVAREAITNALQHGKPSLIRVLLGGSEQTLQLEVVDDGVGIAPPMVQGRAGHLGVVGMRERAIAMGGHFNVGPAEDGGTRVSLHWEAPHT